MYSVLFSIAMPHPELTTFENHGRFGLRQGGQVVLAAGFDSVWELGHGFWAARRKKYYCVVAPDGRRITDCVLPAYLMGYEMLSWHLQRFFVQRGAHGLVHLLAMHRQLREQAAYATIVVVTARCRDNAAEVWAFLRLHDLPVQAVHCTDDGPKRDVLVAIGAERHYDDRDDRQELAGSGVAFFRVDPGPHLPGARLSNP